jgi:hypothetical protein
MEVKNRLFATPPDLEICQHIRLYAPLACTVKQPLSTPTATTITVVVATTAASTNNISTTSWPTTSTTNTNMIYVLRYKP